jgi:hypothetical protein
MFDSGQQEPQRLVVSDLDDVADLILPVPSLCLVHC